nr:DsrE family protein [Enterovibrio paralichthyis]
MESSNIAVLVNGAAVAVFDGSSQNDYQKELDALNKAGAKIHVCRNSMKAQNIDLAALPDFVQEVPVGVLYLVARQSEGFAYIKP